MHATIGVVGDDHMIRTAMLPVLFAVSLGAADATAQTASRVIRAIDERCAHCHVDSTAKVGEAAAVEGAEGAPTQATLRQMAPETILQAITRGAMRVHAEGLTDEYKLAMAEFISGRKLAPLEAGDARNMPNRWPRTRTPTP